MSMINHIIVSQLVVKVIVFLHVPEGADLVFLYLDGFQQGFCVGPNDR